MAAIPLTPVTSKAVTEIGYDPESKVMRVRYASGGLYDFPDIEPTEYQALLNAESIGGHLNTHYRGRGTRVP